MKNSFKFSTFVTKLVLFSLIMASFGLSVVRADDGFKEEDKRVFGQLRLSLWYMGIDSNEEPAKRTRKRYYQEFEELRGPVEDFLSGASR